MAPAGRIATRGLREHRRRFMHTAAAVALAVGLVSGTFILTDTIAAGLRHATGSHQSADIVVRHSSAFTAEATGLPQRQPVPGPTLDAVRAVPGVGSAWGAVWGWAQVAVPGGEPIPPAGLPTVGTSFSPDEQVLAGRAPHGSGEVAVDQPTARTHGIRTGDKVRVVLANGSQEFTVSGLVRPAGVAATTLVAFDTATAQDVLGNPGAFDTISVRAARGSDAQDLRARLNRILPPGVEAVTASQAAGEDAASLGSALGFLRPALLVLAGVALLVGSFIIFNTFSIVVAQRTRELGLLRAVGASRAQLVRSVLTEATAVGAAASAFGVVVGFGVALGLFVLMGLSGYHYPVHGVVFAPRTALVGLLSGTAVTALAALLPARRATMAAPVSTIADPGATRAMVPGWARRRVVVGLSGGVLGLVFLAGAVAGAFGPPLLLVALGVIALIGGISALNPVIVRPAVRTIASPLVRIGGQTAALGRDNALRNPRRTSATATALMIGIGLVGVVAILGASMKASATQTLRTSLRADFVVSPKGVGAAANGVPPAAAEALRTTPGVAVVSEVRAGQFGLDGTATQLVAVDPATVTATHALDAKSVAAAQALGHGGVLVRNTEASAKGWKVGDEVPMTFARTGPQRLRLAAVFSTTTVRSDYVVSLDTFQANFNQQLDAEVDVRLAAGEAPSSARTRVEAVLRDFPGAEVMNKAQAVGAQQAKVDQVLLPVTAVLALSVLIALLGIANTLALSIHERTHEIGMLRAIGMAKRQLRSMIRSEAAIIALLGSLLGAAVAVLFGWAPVASMRDLGVTQLVVPVRQLAAIVAGATVAGLAAGVLPARRAASLPVLEAMRADQPW